MQLKLGRLFLSVLVLITCISFTNAQEISQKEIGTQLKMVHEILYLRDTVKTLEEQKKILTETSNTNSAIVELKDTQIKMLLEVISEYEKLKKVYIAHIELQNQIINNNNKVISEYQKVSSKNNALNTIKTVLYTILGVLIGKV